MERALTNSNARIMKKSSKYYASIYHNILKNVLEKCSVKTVVYYTKNQKVWLCVVGET